MEIKKQFSLEKSGILSYYVFNKLQNAKSFVEETENENIELPAIKEATLREDGVASVESVKRMSEIIAEQAKMYAAAVRSGLRTPILVEEEKGEESTETVEPEETVGQPAEPEYITVEETESSEEEKDEQVGLFDGTETDVFEQPVLTEDTTVPETPENIIETTEIETDEVIADADVDEHVEPVEPVNDALLVTEADIADAETSEVESQPNFTDEGEEETEDAPVFAGLGVQESITPVVEETATEKVDEVSSEEEEGEEWDCPYCGAKVKGFFCPDCGTAKPKEEEEAPVLNIASGVAEEEETPVVFASMSTEEAKEEVAPPVMEAVEELHKVNNDDEDDSNEYASIADFLKSL